MSDDMLPFEDDEPVVGRQSSISARDRTIDGRRSTVDSLADAEARCHAVDPARNVVLEASAGTGKTRVLVERYVNLLGAGVDPDHILPSPSPARRPPRCGSESSNG
jgi:hypothetical protein